MNQERDAVNKDQERDAVKAKVNTKANAVRKVYRKFIGNRNIHTNINIKPVGVSSAVSSVFKINGNVVAKYVKSDGSNKAFVTNRLFIMNHLGSIINTDPHHEILKKLMGVPFYSEKVPDNAYVTLERIIDGEEFSTMFLQDVDNFKTENHYLKCMFIAFDVLSYLGQKYSFNHNDLHMDNIMVVRAESLGMCHTYTSLTKLTKLTEEDKKNVTITGVKYYPVIIDFDWSTFMGKFKNIEQAPIFNLLAAQIQSKTVNANTVRGRIENENPLPLWMPDKKDAPIWNTVHTYLSVPFYNKNEWSPSIDSGFLLEFMFLYTYTEQQLNINQIIIDSRKIIEKQTFTHDINNVKNKIYDELIKELQSSQASTSSSGARGGKGGARLTTRSVRKTGSNR